MIQPTLSVRLMTFKRRFFVVLEVGEAALAQVFAEVRGRAGGAAVAEDEDEFAGLPGLVNQVGQLADFRQIDALEFAVKPIQVLFNVNRVA